MTDFHHHNPAVQMQNERKYSQFVMYEAQWLDSIVRPHLPSFVTRPVEALSGTMVGRGLHFLVDFFIIGKILGLKIKRSQDTVVNGGPGFRPNKDHGYKIANVRTTVYMRGKEIAQKAFPVDLHFTK